MTLNVDQSLFLANETLLLWQTFCEYKLYFWNWKSYKYLFSCNEIVKIIFVIKVLKSFVLEEHLSAAFNKGQIFFPIENDNRVILLFKYIWTSWSNSIDICLKQHKTTKKHFVEGYIVHFIWIFFFLMFTNLETFKKRRKQVLFERQREINKNLIETWSNCSEKNKSLLYF